MITIHIISLGYFIIHFYEHLQSYSSLVKDILYIRIAFSIELRLRVSRSLRSLANEHLLSDSSLVKDRVMTTNSESRYHFFGAP